MPDWLYSQDERKDLKRLQRKQRIRVRKIENQIVDNEKSVESLGKELVEKQAAFDANRTEFERRKADLLERAQTLRNEIDMLLAGSDEYARVEIDSITLEPNQRLLKNKLPSKHLNHKKPNHKRLRNKSRRLR